MEQSQNKNKFTVEQAQDHLDDVIELFDFYLNGRDEPSVKDLLNKTRQVKKLIEELNEDKFRNQKRFKRKFLQIFGKQKDNLEKEVKELKIELKQEQDKNENDDGR